MIILKDLTESEFNEYFEQSKDRYINDLSHDPELFKRLTGKEPREFAEHQFKTMLSKGVNTPNNSFFKVIDLARKKKVGIAWFIFRHKMNISFIGDIFIRKEERGKGFGTEVLKQLEDIALNQHHTKKIGLNVFRHNPQAKKLYERMGYKVIKESPINYDMMKFLKA